ncbi:MAG: hypothetical protein M3R04_07820 [bacterium]|nr:hypothetical protein [bacterium]
MSFTTGYGNPSGPASDAVAVTPSDATIVHFRGLYVGGAGNVAVAATSGNVTFTAVPAGTILPVNCTKVLSTGTTATSIIGLA